jgi:short subunit dehydrogenase-like uncharacterized protein
MLTQCLLSSAVAASAGELVWVKRMIEAHHDTAAAKGVKVVHCCGYDSTPFDLGVLLLADHARKHMGR